MRISELSRRTGVSAASIKYYAREGLLPAGERTGYNQTEYGDAHVARLRLIRALLEVGGLSIAATQRVLAAIDDPGLPLAEVMGVAQHALPRREVPPSDANVARVLEVARARGWHVGDDNPGTAMAAGVLDTFAQLGRDDLATGLPVYAAAAEQIAEADVDRIADRQGREDTAATVVVGTVLGDVLLAGLRRIAQAHVAYRRYGPDSDEGDPR